MLYISPINETIAVFAELIEVYPLVRVEDVPEAFDAFRELDITHNWQHSRIRAAAREFAYSADWGELRPDLSAWLRLRAWEDA